MVIIGYHKSDQEKYKILIVDDEPTTFYLLENVLTKLDFEVFWAKDGQDGFIQVKSYLPDVILLDLVMPIMDGFELIRYLRADTLFKRIPIIVILAGLNDSDYPELWKINCDAFITKPIQPTTLLVLLQKTLNLSWIRAKPEESPQLVQKVIEPTAIQNDPLQAFICPSSEQIHALLELAMMGDIGGILEKLN